MTVGPAFSDHIKTEKIFKRRFGEKTSRLRTYPLLILLFLLGGLLFFKLADLQLLQGKYYRLLSDSNRIRTRIIHAPRGIITDRNGVPLVYNAPGFRKVENGKTIQLTEEEALPLLAKNDQSLTIDSLRMYPYKEAEAHIVGYLGQITPKQLKEPEFSSYQVNDLVGESGIEQEYEHELRGTDGQELIEVDALNNPVRILGKTDPIPGQDVQLTIDIKLQQAVYTAMKTVQKGAAIVSTPNGQILAMVSKPSFDPNLFTQNKGYHTASDSAYQNLSQVLLDGQNQPLLNRAISGLYPPGSTFKLIVSAAGLEDKVIDTKFSIIDTGILKLGQFSFANWYYTDYGKTEQGPINVVRAIARSNDIFFYKIAQMIGVNRISQMAEKFGLGHLLGIDLAGEETGTVPTTDWKKKTTGEDWYVGDTYHYGIGQGYLLTTPLQVNMWTGVFANNGQLYKPHLLSIKKPIVENSHLISSETLQTIKQGMVEACSTGGVAYPLFNFGIPKDKLTDKSLIQQLPTSASASAMASTKQNMQPIQVACKTGTAEHGDATTKPHAWLTAFAPSDKPQVVVTVLSESSGEGSTVAGPIVKDILTAYFEGK